MNKSELYQYLNNFDWQSKKESPISSVYFLIRNGEHSPEPIYFTHYMDVWFESPCCLFRFPLKDDELDKYIESTYSDSSRKGDWYAFERLMQRDGWHYDIDCPQCSPFLEDDIEIISPLSETECLDWLLEHTKF